MATEASARFISWAGLAQYIRSLAGITRKGWMAGWGAGSVGVFYGGGATGVRVGFLCAVLHQSQNTRPRSHTSALCYFCQESTHKA